MTDPELTKETNEFRDEVEKAILEAMKEINEELDVEAYLWLVKRGKIEKIQELEEKAKRTIEEREKLKREIREDLARPCSRFGL